MTKTRKVFYSQKSRTPFMTKRSFKSRLYEADADYDEPIEDFEDIEQNVDDELLSQIEIVIDKINELRRRRGNTDLLDIDSFVVSEATLDELYDMLEDEKSENMTDREPDDNEIFDNPEDLDDNVEYNDYEESPVTYDNFDDDRVSSFIEAMDQQLKYGEDAREPFYLVLKNDPDIDYEAIVITKFGSGSNPTFLFKIVSVDGDEVNLEKQIHLGDIDVDSSDFENLMN